MDTLSNRDKRYIRESFSKISVLIIYNKPRAQIIAAYSRLIKRMWEISQSKMPEFLLMKLKQDLKRANSLKTNSKSTAQKRKFDPNHELVNECKKLRKGIIASANCSDSIGTFFTNYKDLYYHLCEDHPETFVCPSNER
nr:uncharacterized protein LOC124493367 [Dermatophagoides farinae]